MYHLHDFVLEHPRHMVKKNQVIPMPATSQSTVLTGFHCVGGKTSPSGIGTQEFEWSSKALENHYASLN
jgi:hypothetical protein